MQTITAIVSIDWMYGTPDCILAAKHSAREGEH
jgi:hypothetical protein